MPAAAVIPAPIAYIKVVAVKKLVVVRVHLLMLLAPYAFRSLVAALNSPFLGGVKR